MIRSRCTDCGEHFHREAEQTWKVRCLSCYIAHKSAAPARPAPPTVDPAYQEFLGNLRELIQLTHPDRHGGSPLSNRISGWLLSVRNRVAERVQ